MTLETNGTEQSEVIALRQQLAAAEQREHVMRQLLDQVPATIYATRRDGTILFVNTTFAAQWSKLPEDFEGRGLYDLFPPETAAIWQQTIEQGINSGSVFTNQETYGEGAGVRHYDNVRFPLRDSSGNLIALGGIASDITERVRAEAAYASTRRVLEGIVNSSPAAIAVKTPEGRLMLANETYAALARRPVETVVEQMEHTLFPADVVAAWDTLSLFRDGKPLRSEVTFAQAGSERTFITIQFPLYDEQQRPYAICSISTDVTELKRAERERDQFQQEIIEAQRAALHELSTPLIPLAEGVVVMPLIGSIDSGRAMLVMETLLDGVSRLRARIAIVDITGLPVIDSQVANALIRAAQSVKLLGAEVILTGIGPEVAQTLIGIGANLSDLKTPGTLQAGITYALQHQDGFASIRR